MKPRTASCQPIPSYIVPGDSSARTIAARESRDDCRTGFQNLTLRAGFVKVSEARSDWAPDPNNPLPKFSPPRRVPHGITLIGRLFEEGTVARAGLALEKAFGVVGERPPGF